MQDKLEHIFYLQRLFDEDLIKRREMPDLPWHEWIQKEVLAIVAELGELLDEAAFKWWKEQEVNREGVKEELVDILHFFISMCIKADISAEDLYQAYLKKNQENFDRQDGLSMKEGYMSNPQ
ncbi:MAG: dUTPase [Clostridia bacterium]|mgnify:CR=1 FL=1|nr:dUTPase [Clostridia bacterium]